ncbi:hypothetical protein K491DRAFT_711426 [Lophiostoma macrostomum CBS 122681]|uniref:Uncharacterized protein n=1 Tax=Lophiostoma macrostomum CBS 122681 TaxID=1314788 RepID=A0A6A6TQG2_9PLEO|nr:hypothetical protein K491DRAFT_711426 [Lophiostoma macrostomum CBS 122681]
MNTRASKFTEGTMNSTTAPAADIQWMDLGMEEIIRRCNEQQTVPAPAAEAAAEAPLTPAPASDGILGRFGRAAASFFRGSNFSTLGKRKERDGEKKEEGPFKKEQYERTYADMKAQGLFTPKVMVRPRTQQQRAAVPSHLASTSTPLITSAPTPALRASTSKKDLQKQLKLTRQVSDLEHKLAQARKKLSEALGEDIPPVPELPPTPALSPTPVLLPTLKTSSSHFFSKVEISPHIYTEAVTPRPSKITKKRKASGGSDDDDPRRDPTYKPTPTDTESDYASSEHSSKKSKLTNTTHATSKTLISKPSSRRLRKVSGATTTSGTTIGGRLKKKKSQASTTTREEVVIIVPDGVAVPPIPSIPNGTEGKRAAVSTSRASDDGFGGLGHEIF